MNPVIIHADGTDCRHDGEPQATALDGAPLCPAGQPVTHIRFNGQVLTIEQAAAVFMNITRAFTEALAPISRAFTEFARRVSEARTLPARNDRNLPAEHCDGL